MINISSLKPSINLRPPKLIIYGPNKIGKSKFGADAPNPIVMDIENGMENIYVPKYKINKFSDSLDFMRALYSQPHDYKYLIVDSLDWLEMIMTKELCQTYKARTLYDKDCKAFLFGGGGTLLLNMWEKFLLGLDFLHKEKNMGIILIAHHQIKKFEDPLTASYDQYSLKLEKKSSEKIKEWVDCILFATLKVNIENEKKDFGGVVKHGIGSDRIIYTQSRPSFEAGNRFNLPFQIECSWQSFYNNFNKYQESLKNLFSESDKNLSIEDKKEEHIQSKDIQNNTETISDFQVSFIKRMVTPQRLNKILEDYKISSLEEMIIKDYHTLNDQLRLESLTLDSPNESSADNIPYEEKIESEEDDIPYLSEEVA